MTWETYYEKFYDWSESTAASYLSRLADFGPSAEVCEIAQMFSEEAAANRLIRKALAAGVRFTAEEIGELDGVVPESLMPQLVQVGEREGYCLLKKDADRLKEYEIIIPEDVEEPVSRRPYYRMRGCPVSREQALELIRRTDNYFYEPIGRFPAVEEDEPAYRLLCTEYPEAK